MRRHRLVLLIALLSPLALLAAPASSASAPTLRVGGSHFWQGPTLGRTRVDNPALCGVAADCPAYPMVVSAGAGELRVAIDWSDRDNSFTLQVMDPAGKVASQLASAGRYSMELFLPRPAAGTWTARVIPTDVTNSSFRLRALLAKPEKRGKAVLQYPNLQIYPPWEPTLIGPVASVTRTPAQVGTVTPWSCTPEEQAIHRVSRCLRFSVGPMNAGPGRYEARFSPLAGSVSSTGQYVGPVTQRIYRTDGTWVERPAGTWTFHEIHGHFHVEDLLSYELYRVTDPGAGSLSKVGVGRKASFCTYDLKLPSWQTFSTPIASLYDSSVCTTPPDSGSRTLVMGVTPGWADVYTWNLADQFVDFAAGQDGDYVIRALVNPVRAIAESRYDDNAGYALVRITGNKVHLLERGRGLSPWDRKKVVMPPTP